MKALSIKQPWAWLIIFGGKDVENRSWRTNYRGEFLVHAGKSIDYHAYDHLIAQGVHLPAIKDLQTGGFIGKVTITDCTFNPPNRRWYMPLPSHPIHAFVLKDPKPCRFMQYPGKLNFFDVPDDQLNINLKSIFDPVNLEHGGIKVK